MGVNLYFKLIFLFCVVNGERNKTVVNNLPTNLHVTSSNTNNQTRVNRPPVCHNRFMDLEGKVPISNLTIHCANKHCIAKCCRSINRIMFADEINNKTACVDVRTISAIIQKNITVDYSLINIYKSSIEYEKKKTNLSLLQDFLFVMNKRLSDPQCSTKIPPNSMKNHHILENNRLVMEIPNFFERFVHYWDMGEFCLEHLVIRNADGIQGPFKIFRYPLEKEDVTADQQSMEHVWKAVAMLISCFFLLLVLFIYGSIRELQNLVGMVLMAYVGTLAVTFFLKPIELLGVQSHALSSEVCKPMSVFLYYTTISSFFWMNVMSLDIWWTFRGMFKSRPIHRRGELVKFGWYALYSWGVPLLITIAVGVIDYSDLSHIPQFYKPHFEFCFYIKDKVMEMRRYLYVPIFVLLVGDWLFFLMTAFNIWRIKRCMAKFANEANKYNNNQNRFGLYLKLSLVMGVSWVFETIDMPWWMQTVATAYNALIGVAIFFIFCFKRKILFKLTKRFSIKSAYINDLERKYSRSYSTSAASSGDRKRSDVELTSTSGDSRLDYTSTLQLK